jgi:hypothetical protein
VRSISEERGAARSSAGSDGAWFGMALLVRRVRRIMENES